MASGVLLTIVASDGFKNRKTGNKPGQTVDILLAVVIGIGFITAIGLTLAGF